MSQSTTQRQEPSEAACEEASESIRGFVSGLLDVDRERALRAHLDRCGDCRDHYRAAVITTAHIGRERRLERDAREKRVRSERLRRMARDGQPGGRPSFFRLRTLLYPAFFAFLMWQVSGLLTRNSGIAVERLEGSVSAGPLELFDGRGRAPLGIGQPCSTEADGSARVEAGSTNLVLGPQTDLVLESAQPLRVRLGRGSLRAHGTCVVATRLGIVDVTKGQAEVALGRGALQIRALEGECAFTGPDGVRTIERGASLVVPTVAIVPSPGS
jgi:hypothetical protein